jgi:hypothetical protein
MVRSARVEKALFIPLLAMLFLFEMYMLTAFLPKNWEHAISEQLVLPFDRESYQQSRVTHPNLEGEIDQVLRENPRLRITGYVIFVALLSGNTFLIVRVWRALKRKSYANY